MLSNLTGWHAVVILAIILLIFGAAKLPALAKGVGQSVRILKDEASIDSTRVDNTRADNTRTNHPSVDRTLIDSTRQVEPRTGKVTGASDGRPVTLS